MTMRREPVWVIGAGPAGSIAAIRLLQLGIPVKLFDKTPFPRDKVCGEFLSAEALAIIEKAGFLDQFIALNPPQINRFRFFLTGKVLEGRLPRPAVGISRLKLDFCLYQHAVQLGAECIKERVSQYPAGSILAAGRLALGSRGKRWFGFKAHFRGSWDDAVEMHFFREGYVGVAPVENGLINVCGLATEAWLARFDFNFEEALAAVQALKPRLAKIERVTRWLTTAGASPYLATPRRNFTLRGVYPAGDRLSFIDPFTGSGMLNAMMSGWQAAEAVARGLSVEEYFGMVYRALRVQYWTASLLRLLIQFTPAILVIGGRHLGKLYEFIRPVRPN